jgi:predicted alpha-1,6-mannanase (GH76 family)
MKKLKTNWLLPGLMAMGMNAPCGTAPRKPTAPPPAAVLHRRADAAIESFLLKFWNPDRSYLNAAYPANGRLTGYWTYALGWDALIENAERTHGRQYAGLIETFYNGQDARGWHSDYYDDENWMVLTLLHAHSVTHEPKYLSQAESLFSDIESAWDTTCCGAAPGGIWWNRAHTQKATASNAGPVIAACRLFEATHRPSYLDFARRVYDFWWRNMVDPVTFQVADHLNPDGAKIRWKFTYNEGLMIGASVALFAATREARYRADAHQVAGFMVRNEVVPTRYGPALFDGTNDRCRGDAQEFKAPAYHYLSELNGVSPRSAYAEVLNGSATAIWDLARDPALDLFAVDWAGPPQSRVSDRQQNAAAFALCDNAMSRGEDPEAKPPPRQYEAEDGTIHSLALENTYPGFSGWGYIGGWDRDGQWVEFRPDLPAGTHKLTFRYAAGEGDARRAVSLNGRTVLPNLRFPSTGAWDRYRTVQLSLRFPAGAAALSLAYDASHDSSGVLHLDRLTTK